MNQSAMRQLGWTLALYLIGYGLITLPVVMISGQLVHAMMVWNVFLAMLPILFAGLAIVRLMQKRWAAGAVFSIIWLLLFPNAPYLVTDIIHLTNTPFYTYAPYQGTVYTQDVLLWARLLHIGLGMVLGTGAGLLSLYWMQRYAAGRWGRALSWLMAGAVCLLAGYGIYIGRFLRFNSWDILAPLSLLTRLWYDMDIFALKTSLLFAAYIALCYLSLYPFYHHQWTKEEMGK